MKRQIIRYGIALIWLINGLFCKLLGMVPRHERIIASILGEEHSRTLSIMIGIAEILMAIWIISGLYRRLNAVIQILVIAVMNTLEFFLVPDLLLWRRFNAIFAIILIIIIYTFCYKRDKNALPLS